MKITRYQLRYARRKCIKIGEASKRETFVAACLKGKDMFNELNVYKDIYNQEATNEPLQELHYEVHANGNYDTLKDVEKVTTGLVKTIGKEKLKCSKTDQEFDLTTDAFTGSPDILFKHLTYMFHAMLIHS